MPRSNDWTNMGGGDGHFRPTRWTPIAESHTSNEEKHNLIINDLCGLYRKPVYCYLRRKGYDNETSEDLTQGFFHEIVLGRKLITRADKSKGKFRTFLLTALNNYVIDINRSPSPADPWQLEDIDIPCADHKSPEEEFNRTWVAELLEKTLSQVQQECQQTNKEIHWAVFRAKVLTPIVENIKPPSMTDICKEYGIGTEAQASNMIVTVKRRLKKYMERNLRLMVCSDAEIQPEISALLKNLT